MSVNRLFAVVPGLFVMAMAHPPAAAFGLEDLRKMLGGAGVETGGLSQEDAVAGLREALHQGAQIAVDQLGAQGGFLDNPAVKIPPPPPLAGVESTLRRIGLSSLADDFSRSVNRAAEQAVAVALPVLAESVSAMSVGDALTIVRGTEHAATDYLRDSSGAVIRDRMLPLVATATAETGVTNYYKKLADGAGPLLSGQLPDLDGYVTDRAVDGLFQMIAAEEARIRENPAARSTELLQRVFAR